MSKTQAAHKQHAVADNSIGHNRPPVLTPDALTKDFGYLDNAIAELEKQVTACPSICEDEDDLEILRAAVKNCIGAHKRMESVRVEAKEPYLSAERIVDSHFNVRKSKIAGWKEKLEEIAHRFLKKKEAAERAEREEIARKAAEEARKAAEELRLAEEKRIAAEQERLAKINAPSIEPDPDGHDGEHFNALESEARIEESVARDNALAATSAAITAQKATEAKPADLARVRTGNGISTLQEIWKFEVIDLKQALTDETLQSFISTAEVEKAIGRYVNTHKGDRPLNGVRIYSDTKPRMS